jgi:hypothetical protein
MGEPHRLVIVELKGGTGNWLFQAFHGQAFAKRHGANLLFDDVVAMHGACRTGLLSLFAFIDRAKHPSSIQADVTVQETYCNIHTGVGLHDGAWPDACTVVRLVGFFQAVPTPAPYLNAFIDSLSFSTVEQLEAAELVPDPEHTAFIHLRRGDYLAPGNCHLFHTVTKEYVEACVGRLPARCAIVLFTNDVPWAKEQMWLFGERTLLIAAPEVCMNTTLAAMARCRFGIISNSTFGAWGALLAGRFHEAKVQMPVQWLVGHPTPTLPLHWTRVDNVTGTAIASV